MIETANTLGLGKPQTSIIEAESGKIVFNSNEAETKISGKRPLYHLGKELATIEVRKNGYFITSLQNTSLVDFDGKVIFNHKRFKSNPQISKSGNQQYL